MNSWLGLGFALFCALVYNVGIYILTESGAFKGWRADAWLYGVANLGILIFTGMFMFGGMR